MSRTHTSWKHGSKVLAIGGAMVVGALALLQASAGAAPGPVTAPTVPGAPALFGPVVSAGTPAATLGTLKTSPDVAPAGTKVTITGSGLAASKAVGLVWMTANVRYVLDAKPDSVDYIGRKVDPIAVALANATTDASGAFKVTFTVPKDYGGLHDIFAVVNGSQVAKGGFLLERTVTISPKKGPVGTPITITVNGMGSPTYESVGSLLYDNKYAGAVSANTTRGWTKFTIRASGKPGAHVISYEGSSHTVPYLNMDQSPVPWTAAHKLMFTVTKDAGAPKPSLDWPADVQPTMAERTTVLSANVAQSSTATAKLDTTAGPILTKVNVTAAGLTPNVPAALQWTSVVGNRVNCTGTCWNFVNQQLGSAQVGADGTLKTQVTVPDGLGGWHAVQVVQNGQIKAQTPFYVKRSFVSIPKTVKAGEPFVVELKGVGWTQIDNTVGVTYDNSYIGYACGFNSNGYVRIQLTATGEPGTHLIDLYPLLYTQQPAYPYSQLGMVPLLGFAHDAPGLAAGYDLPAYRLAITVVE
jgi:hypothetical protein